MSKQKVDVLVIGGGIVGITVARQLQSEGRKVVLIDKGTAGTGCSWGNAGWITPCFAMPLPQPGMLLKSIGWLLDDQSPLYIKPDFSSELLRWMLHFMRSMNHQQMNRSIDVLTEISKYSLNFYREFSTRASAAVAYENRGLLMVSGTQDGLKHAEFELELMAKRGIAGRKMSRDEVLNFEPAVKPLVQGGVFFPDEAQTEPFQMVRALVDEFVSLGGSCIEQAEVFDFVIQDGKLQTVITTNGNYEADLVVMAGGPWSRDLGRQLGLRIPLLGGKGYSMHIDIGEKKPKTSIMIVERKIAVTPRAQGMRLAGTLELVNQDFSISPNRVRAIHRGAQEYLQMEGASEPKQIWRGLRPCTPDGVPVIGYSDRLSNLFYCLGHQMLGLQSAPGSAKLAADLIAKRTPYVDPAPFKADRFGL
jgi:D-amino-acid dehydrogenase